jgi:hypothetical protein
MEIMRLVRGNADTPETQDVENQDRATKTPQRRLTPPAIRRKPQCRSKAKVYLTMRAIYWSFALAAIIAIPQTSAEPNKDQYELQERCGKRAEEVFKRDYAFKGGGVTDTKDGEDMTVYENHYNAMLNKCFVLEKVTSIKYKTNKGTATKKTLFDVNEHKVYGIFFIRSEFNFPLECRIQQKICHSEGEWEELLKPYMEQ